MNRILKNRIFAAAVLLFFAELAGAFVIAAPILVFLRNQFSKSELALDFWPIISQRIISDVLINDLQAIVMFVLGAMIIFILYILFKTFILGGIYNLIIFGDNPEHQSIRTLNSFLARCAELWPGFLKISLFGILVYGIALFLGLSFGQLFARTAITWRILILAFFLLTGSAYLQILRAQIVAENNTSIRQAMKSTQQVIAESFIRIVVGNVSVAIVGGIVILIIWLILKGFRHYDWNLLTSAGSIIFEQAIILTLSLTNVVRVNFNYSVIKSGKTEIKESSAEDAAGALY